MIKLISTRPYPKYAGIEQVPLTDFNEWIKPLTEYQLDIETNVVELLTEREIYVVQFGDMQGETQYVLDVASFTEDALNYIIRILNNATKTKIIHNAIFEYSVIKQCWNIDIDNLYDTYLMLKVILNGRLVPKDIYSLKGALHHFAHVEMSKEEQTSFTGAEMTEAQIKYAAKDVAHMHTLRNYHIKSEYYRYFKNVINMENKVVRAFGDIVTYGFRFDAEKWKENMEWVKPQIEEAKSEFFQFIRTNMREDAIRLGFLVPEDTVTIKWTSPIQRKKIFEFLYPDLVNFTRPALKKFELTLIGDDNPIYYYLTKDYDKLNEYLLTYRRTMLKDFDFLIEANTITINLNSPQQRLALFQIIEPSLTSTAAEAMENLKHPIFKVYGNYISKSKLLSAYGEKWFEFVSPDGRIRPQFVDQILDTGRVSVQKPGMMTLPADEGYYLGNRYREPFLPTVGWSIVAGDYNSQELAVIAYLAQEHVWLDAIATGRDLHSVCASLVFGQKWIDAGGDPQGRGKPTTDDAIKLRSFTKAISFGLAYGGGPGMLASRLNISMNESRQLIKDYFGAFPKLKAYFAARAARGLAQGFIETAAPFNRRRYFPLWAEGSMDHAEAASIERQSKNTTIQGTGADGTKVAMILIKEYIEKHNLGDKVRILFMLHDAIITEARNDFKEEWAIQLKELMEVGHEANIPNRLISAAVDITETWTK